MSKPREVTIDGQLWREVPRRTAAPHNRSAQDLFRGREAQDPDAPLDPGAEPPVQPEPSQQGRDQWEEAVFACIGYARDLARQATELKDALEKTADKKRYTWLSADEAQGLKDDLAKGVASLEQKSQRLKSRQVEQV